MSGLTGIPSDSGKSSIDFELLAEKVETPTGAKIRARKLNFSCPVPQYRAPFWSDVVARDRDQQTL